MIQFKLLLPDLPSREELLPFLERIDAARHYTNFGPLVRELEGRLGALHADRDGLAPHVCSVANATLGLELALRAVGLKPNSKVLVPGFTFPATVTAVLRSGFEPVVCDVDASGWVLSPEIARSVVSRHRIDAVMPVTTYGAPLDSAGWDAFSDETGLPVIVDAAGAFGNQQVGRKTVVVISMHATKTLGAGEGGAVISHDAAVTEHVARESNFGIDTRSSFVQSVGTNAKLSEYHAAVGLAALARREARDKVRIDLHERYSTALGSRCPKLQLQARPPRGVYSILAVLLPAGRRAADAVPQFSAQGIETRRWYWPTVREHPAFRNLTAAGDMSGVHALGERAIGLPFHPFLSAADVEAVVAACESYLRV